MLVRLNFTLFAVICFMASGCNGSKTNSESKPLKKEGNLENISFVTLLSTSHSNVSEATQRVITSQQGLEDIYTVINSTKTPKDVVPEIDFSTQEVFFYTPGEVSHGVPGIEVESVTKSDDKLIVRIKEYKPDPSGYVTTVMSQPAVLIQYEKQGLAVQIKTTQEK